MEKHALYLDGFISTCRAKGVEPQALFKLALDKLVQSVPTPEGAVPGAAMSTNGFAKGQNPQTAGNKALGVATPMQTSPVSPLPTNVAEGPNAISRMYGGGNSNGNKPNVNSTKEPGY